MKVCDGEELQVRHKLSHSSCLSSYVVLPATLVLCICVLVWWYDEDTLQHMGVCAMMVGAVCACGWMCESSSSRPDRWVFPRNIPLAACCLDIHFPLPSIHLSIHPSAVPAARSGAADLRQSGPRLRGARKQHDLRRRLLCGHTGDSVLLGGCAQPQPGRQEEVALLRHGLRSCAYQRPRDSQVRDLAARRRFHEVGGDDGD